MLLRYILSKLSSFSPILFHLNEGEKKTSLTERVLLLKILQPLKRVFSRYLQELPRQDSFIGVGQSPGT